MTRCATLGAAVCALAAAANERPTETALGPVWQEECVGGGTDAASLPPGAQATEGAGTLQAICGSMAQGEGVDYEDMYRIRVCDPSSFRASTTFAHGGASDFDTQLWLFRRLPGPPPPVAVGLLANDNAPSGATIRSVILPEADDGSGAALTMPGIYFLAISGSDNDPVSPGGIIFSVPPGSETEISGPDGPGGPLPVSGWTFTGIPEVGTYTIALTGVAFAVGATIDCNCNGVYDNCDLALGTSLDENGDGIPDECQSDCPEDLSDNDAVDVADLLIVLANWDGVAGDVTGDCQTNVDDILAILAAWGPCP